MIQTRIQEQMPRLLHIYPAALAAGTVWLAFALLGNTPLIRTTALALVIMAISLTLRQLGPTLSYLGGVVFGFSPVYWSQAGGTAPGNEWELLLFGLAAIIAVGAVSLLGRRLFYGLVAGGAVFVGLYLLFGPTEKSLRLTTILAAWLMYMMVVALRQTNPRPGEPPARQLSKRHVNGVLVVMVLGVLNDPLFTLFAPAVVLGLWLSRPQMPRWYVVALILTMTFGGWGLITEYIDAEWVFRSTDAIRTGGYAGPYISLTGWRDPVRWLEMTQLVTYQLTWLGAILGVVGIARLSRWYPTLGTTLMVAYASYGAFGIVYMGRDIEILLLPLFMIQTICMTYAVYVLMQWLQRLFNQPQRATLVRWLVTGGYAMMSGVLVLRALG
jgi:hypothetical protein